MLRILLVTGLAIIVAGGGIALGWWLRPPPVDPPVPEVVTAPPGGGEYVRLANQFVVPVLEGGRVNALVVLALSLEVGPGRSVAVLEQEPRLRDEFLQVLFDHANSGGFRGTFTETAQLLPLRGALLEAARRIAGREVVIDILITDLVRQGA